MGERTGGVLKRPGLLAGAAALVGSGLGCPDPHVLPFGAGPPDPTPPPIGV